MVWGAFTSFEKSPLVIIPPTEQSTIDFVHLVYKGTFSGFYFMHDQPDQLTLMEDGALIYCNRYPNHWREAHGIKKMNWPPNLLDLNPTENLWKIIKDLLRHHSRPKSKDKMIQIIQEVWAQVSQEQLQRLFLNMPARMQAIIEAKGGSTRW